MVFPQKIEGPLLARNRKRLRSPANVRRFSCFYIALSSAELKTAQKLLFAPSLASQILTRQSANQYCLQQKQQGENNAYSHPRAARLQPQRNEYIFSAAEEVPVIFFKAKNHSSRFIVALYGIDGMHILRLCVGAVLHLEQRCYWRRRRIHSRNHFQSHAAKPHLRAH